MKDTDEKAYLLEAGEKYGKDDTLYQQCDRVVSNWNHIPGNSTFQSFIQSWEQVCTKVITKIT
jgi:hypothetical protein